MTRGRTTLGTLRIKTPPDRPASRSCRAEPVHLYGWDSLSGTWNGPNQLGWCSLPDRRLLRELEAAPGKSWYGPVNCRTSDGPATRFFVLVHDLSDCGIASIYCDESKAGPAEILAVIPAHRRSHLRDEGGAVTGEGGDRIVCDDPNNVNEVESDSVRRSTNDWFDVVMSTRVNDPKTAAKVVVMQRCHQQDLSGHLLEQGDWEHLCPAGGV